MTEWMKWALVAFYPFPGLLALWADCKYNGRKRASLADVILSMLMSPILGAIGIVLVLNEFTVYRK